MKWVNNMKSKFLSICMDTANDSECMNHKIKREIINVFAAFELITL